MKIKITGNFTDEIPEEMVKVYDIVDMMESWLLKNVSSGSWQRLKNNCKLDTYMQSNYRSY